MNVFVRMVHIAFFQYYRGMEYTIPEIEIILIVVEKGYEGSQLPGREPVYW